MLLVWRSWTCRFVTVDFHASGYTFPFARTARNSLKPAVFVKVPPKSNVNQRSISLRDLLGVFKTF